MRVERHTTAVEADWAGVDGMHPCPVCRGVAGGCRIHMDEPFACCARTPSDWPLTNGEWLHRTELDPAAA